MKRSDLVRHVALTAAVATWFGPFPSRNAPHSPAPARRWLHFFVFPAASAALLFAFFFPF